LLAEVSKEDKIGAQARKVGYLLIRSLVFFGASIIPDKE